MSILSARRGRRRRDPEGRMPLREHLVELRSRVVRSALGLLAGGVAGWFLYDHIFALLAAPVVELQRQGAQASINLAGVAAAFDLKIKMSLWTGALISSPVWIYQLWAFVTPGLTRRERRYAIGFLGAAVPLFLTGAYLALQVLPNAVSFLFAFTPAGASNFTDSATYFSFVMRIVLAFGVAFLLPVLLVALNFVGLLSGRQLRSGWRIAVFLVFVFAAVATPTPDAVSMLLLAGPMVLLYVVAVLVALANDRRRGRHATEPDFSHLDDDTASPL